MVRELIARPWGLLLAFLLAGCQPERVTRANYDRLEIGMKLSEAEAILGKPDHNYQGVVSWSTNHSQTVVSVVLDDQGRVSEKSADNLQ